MLPCECELKSHSFLSFFKCFFFHVVDSLLFFLPRLEGLLDRDAEHWEPSESRGQCQELTSKLCSSEVQLQIHCLFYRVFVFPSLLHFCAKTWRIQLLENGLSKQTGVKQILCSFEKPLVWVKNKSPRVLIQLQQLCYQIFITYIYFIILVLFKMFTYFIKKGHILLYIFKYSLWSLTSCYQN